MIEIVDSNDARTVRNKDNILAFYDLMINRKKRDEAVAKFLAPGYIHQSESSRWCRGSRRVFRQNDQGSCQSAACSSQDRRHR